MSFGRKKIPLLFWFITCLYLIYCFWYTPNFTVSILVALFPLVAYRFFWIDGYPNVLFFGVMLQWLSCSTQLLYCNFLRIPIDERNMLSGLSRGTMNEATLLNVIGLFAFSFGLFLFVRKVRLPTFDKLMERYDAKKVLILYVFVSIVILASKGVIWLFPSVVQYIVFFFYLKWGFFVVAFYYVHKKSRILRVYLYAFMLFEFSLGVVSFFAGSLVELILFSFITIILIAPKVNARALVVSGVLFVLILHFLILWTSVKQEYRLFISKGKEVQQVLVTTDQAQARYFELMSNVTSKQYKAGIEQLVDRLGYIQFFATSLDYVPKWVPHQGGKIYLSAINNLLVPRFLNPNKEILDDSKHTAKYTGIKLNQAATSFSLGYIADAYIDFGKLWMHLIIFFVGCLFGLFYSHLARNSANAFWIWIFTSPFLLLVNINGTDTKKALGWVVIYFLVVAILQSRIYKTIEPFIRN